MTSIRIEDKNEYLKIYFNAANKFSNYHYFWLRHNCPCCIHPSTKERILCPSKVSLAIRPQQIAVVAEENNDTSAIQLVWQDGHQSTFPLPWLAAHAYSTDELFQIQSQDLNQIEVPYADCADQLVSTCKQYLDKKGVILVRGCRLNTEQLVHQLTQQTFTLRDSHFGYIEDLKTDNTTNKNTDQLGYTDAGIDLHTDQPFIEDPPRFQILQCIQKADHGGESLLADARQAAHYLRDLDAHAFQILSETPVLFHRKQQQFESKTTYPILTFKAGAFAQVRSSYFTIAPQTMSFDAMEQWYRAYQKFTQIIQRPSYQYHFTLHPQDFILYDNYRMLHGRNSFSGPRWMKGIYLN
jgi:gamma-butyrobetaine dioxygenase/trimethyllysine dioxygenase